MHYRYPPVTYLLLFPLSKLSLQVAGVCWTFLAWVAAALTTAFVIRIRHLVFTPASILLACGFLLAYVVLTIRSGNVQPFVIAFIFCALVLSETHPLCAGILFALAITFKIWPLFFVPWFLRRTRLRALAYTALSFLVLWIVPVPILGAARYFSLIHEWYAAEFHSATMNSEIWYFPGQSLRGVLLRSLTPLEPPLEGFPRMYILSLSPAAAVLIWAGISIAVYLCMLFFLFRSDPRKLWAWDGFAFCLFSLIEPFALKSSLISLGPAVLTGACLYAVSRRSEAKQSLASKLFVAASLLGFAGAIVQYKPWQRFLLTIGLDFWAEVLLLVALFIWIVHTPVAERVQSVDPSVEQA